MSDLRVTITQWGQITLDKRGLNALMRAAGNTVKTKTARLIAKSEGGGRQYPAHAATKYRPAAPAYRASAPGLPPAAPTGAMRSSLKTYVLTKKLGFAVRARAFYSLFLESGARGGGNPGKRGVRNPRTAQQKRARGVYTTRVLQPRPFLDKVMDQEAPEIDRRLRIAMREALKWRETKKR
jgi:hypothetical protein